VRLTFLGATQTVTGSKALLQLGRDARLLVDCGLFQGWKELRERNWAALPVEPASIDAVVLTHAHLDHSGYLPLLTRSGFKGAIYCSSGTLDLCKILLRDSAHLLERDAEFANRHGYSKHKPALPLYTAADAEAAIKRMKPVEFKQPFSPLPDVSVTLFPAGHILGAAMALIERRGTSVLFSGDLGRPHDPLMLEPTKRPASDYLVVESTYGDRQHDDVDPEARLLEIVSAAVRRGGCVVAPAFAVGRAQSLLYLLYMLKAKGHLPRVPVFLDSPMAVDASDIFCRHPRDHKLSDAECRALCSVAEYVRDAERSKALDRQALPAIIISASGMATGGRILHHLKALAPDPRNTILLTGFQAAGTRGAQLQAGAKELMIHGQIVPVRAAVESMHMLSAHADAQEITGWLRSDSSTPRRTFIVHGESSAANALSHRIRRELDWNTTIPAYAEPIDLATNDDEPRVSAE